MLRRVTTNWCPHGPWASSFDLVEMCLSLLSCECLSQLTTSFVCMFPAWYVQHEADQRHIQTPQWQDSLGSERSMHKEGHEPSQIRSEQWHIYSSIKLGFVECYHWQTDSKREDIKPAYYRESPVEISKVMLPYHGHRQMCLSKNLAELNVGYGIEVIIGNVPLRTQELVDCS